MKTITTTESNAQTGNQSGGGALQSTVRGPRNARFWSWENCGWVKLTLRPGQTLRWSEAHRTDEGWDSTDERWSHDGIAVISAVVSDGVDCDGRLTRSYAAECWIGDLAIREAGGGKYGPLMHVPEWRKLDGWQRDYTAEAAGY